MLKKNLEWNISFLFIYCTNLSWKTPEIDTIEQQQQLSSCLVLTVFQFVQGGRTTLIDTPLILSFLDL